MLLLLLFQMVTRRYQHAFIDSALLMLLPCRLHACLPLLPPPLRGAICHYFYATMRFRRRRQRDADAARHYFAVTRFTLDAARYAIRYFFAAASARCAMLFFSLRALSLQDARRVAAAVTVYHEEQECYGE